MPRGRALGTVVGGTERDDAAREDAAREDAAREDAMALGERERRLLAALEEHTVREDPALARRFATARWRTRGLLPVPHLGLLVLALGVLTGVHVLVPDLPALASAALTIAAVGSWLVLSARTTPPPRPRWARAGGERPPREGGPRDTGHGGPPACV